ncbi:uncharacterized protein [Arachis hypogaea]|uniref:uncharacterized protein isoform X2 n=1 Tax=Arachis hypogaea TaxID=3818 RepID=UPI003B216455
MNSHFGYECDYNYVVGDENFNEEIHQGWDNQWWEEPYAYDQSSWQQPPPMHYEEEPFFDAYQSNGYGESPCDFQEPPPYAYEPPPQHGPQPHSQASFHQPPSYDPNPYPPFQQLYEPYKPHIESPPSQYHHFQEPPLPYYYQDEPPPTYENFQPQDEYYFPPQPPMEEYLCPSIQEPYDPTHDIQEEQESRDHLKEALDQFQATVECFVQQVERVENIEPPQLYQEEPPSYYEPFPQNDEPFHPPQPPMDDILGVLVQGQEEMKRDVQNFMAALDAVTNQLASQCLNAQGIPMATCGESNEEHSMKERLETPVGNEGSYFVLEQLEEALIVEDKEEVVEDLGDAELPWEHRVEENLSKMIEIDAREGCAQPPRHVPYEDLDGIEQESSFLGDEDQASILSGEESFELEEPSPGAFENVVEVNFFHPPNYSLIKGKGLDSINEQRIELEKSCEEVEVLRNRRMGVEYALSRSLKASLPRLSSTPSLEWVKFISISFIVPLEYGLLETDGQLRMLCGMKRKRKMFRGWHCKSRLIMVDASNMRYKGWSSAQIDGSRRIVGHYIENSPYSPPGWTNNDDQPQDGCENKVWDPGLQEEDQLWEPQACEELHQHLAQPIGNLGAQWRFKHWWKFQDEYKHKPP